MNLVREVSPAGTLTRSLPAWDLTSGPAGATLAKAAAHALSAPLAEPRYHPFTMPERMARATDVDYERRAVLPSVTLVVVIALLCWAAIAAVFGVGRAGIDAAGGVGAGLAGLGAWAAIWVAMWAGITFALAAALLAGMRAWVVLYRLFARPAPRVVQPVALSSAGSDAIAEAEALLRRERRR